MLQPVESLPLEVRDSGDLPYEVFVREYIAANRPVVVQSSTRDWPALSKWTPEFFKTRFGDRQVQVSYEQAMSFSDFIDGVLASTNEKPGPYMYRLFIHEHLPEILPDLVPQNPYSFPRRYASPLMRTNWRRPDGYLKLLIGGIGGRFPVMHFDGENAHATVTEIYGDKEFLVYPPSDGQYLYANPKIPNKSLIAEPLMVDTDKFPLQARATQYRAILRPGDMVFVPCGWWHTARALTPSISVGMNIMDGSNWDGFVSEVFGRHRGALRPGRIMNWAYWTGLGHFLGAMEKMQERLPKVARALVVPQLLAPATSAVAPDPATLKINVPPRED
jgi:hypothetical protein